MLRRSWLEINTEAIRNNYRIYKSLLPETQRIMAVVKADAYGHGEAEVARELQILGCTDFAVSNIEEAKSLRTAGIYGQILILGYTPAEVADELLKYDITQAIFSEEYAERFADKGISAQFAVDTGMNRIGFNASNPEKCEKLIREYSKRFNLTGLFTHLCAADTDSENEFTEMQIQKFREISERVKDLKLPYIHCMNSAGGLRKSTYGNLVRLGIILYGLKPDYGNTLPDGIIPALEWKSVVSMVKPVRAGETVGYGRSYRVNKEMLVATIPTGYADGYDRLLSDKGIVIIHGKKARVIGHVCMDQMMVDVTDIPQTASEDVVTLLGDGYTADDMGHIIDTIGYEIVCNISKRVEKVYK